MRRRSLARSLRGLVPHETVSLMCACDNGERCVYHAKMLDGYQAMWKTLRAIAEGRIEEDPGRVAADALADRGYLHL
jgi:hypothetical protein